MVGASSYKFHFKYKEQSDLDFKDAIYKFTALWIDLKEKIMEEITDQDHETVFCEILRVWIDRGKKFPFKRCGQELYIRFKDQPDKYLKLSAKTNKNGTASQVICFRNSDGKFSHNACNFTAEKLTKLTQWLILEKESGERTLTNSD